MKHEIKIETVEKMLQPTSSKKIIYESLKMVIPKRRYIFKYVGCILVSVIPAYFISTSSQTIELFSDSVQIFNDLIVAIFGIVFTGYALFQALIGKEMLIRMLQNINKTSEKSKLQETNEVFVTTMMLHVVCIIINTIILIYLKAIPGNYCMFENIVLNISTSFIGIVFYFYISFIALIETKSFIFNIFQLFNFHAGARVMEIMRNKDGD